MPNTATISQRQLTSIDKKMYTPDKAQFSGRSMFPFFNVRTWDKFYAYDSITYTAKAKRGTNLATDIPVGDETRTRSFVPITQFSTGVRYSYEELGTSNQVGDNLIQIRTEEAQTAIAEYENKLIFNGELPNKDENDHSSFKIYGITSDPTKTGMQYQDASQSLGANLNDADPQKIMKFFKEMVHRITFLPGNIGKKPILAVSPEIESALDRDYNEYKEDSIEDKLVKKYFSEIKVIPEFDKQFNATKEKQDLCMIYLNDPVTVGIPLAMAMNRLPMEYRDMQYKIPYLERIGAPAIRKPENFVQVQNLLAKSAE